MSAGTWSTATGSRESAQARSGLSPFWLLRMLGSLKITVTLFFFAILIVFVGTLAQDEQTLVEVKREYFNAWISSVPLDVFVPQTIYEHTEPVPYSIPMPGGALIGLILIVNLLAAKSTRFTVRASGLKLIWGIAVSVVGAFLITSVILTGQSVEGLQGQPPITYDQLWMALKLGLLLLTLSLVGYAVWARHLPWLAKLAVWSGVLVMGTLSITLLVSDLRVDDPGLRIVWQLLQATVASCVLLAGFNLLFDKRGGNMLIHVGIALLMVGQFVFGDRQIEQKVFLVEGGQSNVTFLPDRYEIAMIDTSNPNEDSVAVIPDARIRSAIRTGETIDDPALPCLLRIDSWLANSKIQQPEGPNKATQGIGLSRQAVEIRTSGGAMSSVNLPSAYVTLVDRDTKAPIATLLLAQQFNDGGQLFRGGKDRYESLEVAGKQYELALRYQKDYKPYEVKLQDVGRRDYANSNTPRDYYSIINIRNQQTGEEITEKTWMNNPVRFGGETFYQSDYFPVQLADGSISEGSGLQVVKNAGWVIPYVCCMMVMVGMFSHFGGTFVRFANRFAREQSQSHSTAIWTYRELVYLSVGLGLATVMGLYGLQPKKHGPAGSAWVEIGKLPVKQDGRIKPADTVAANTLQYLSEQIFGGLAYVVDDQGNQRSRVEWLLGVMTDQAWTKEVPVFRVYAKEVRELLELPDRDKYRYTYNEVDKGRPALDAEMKKLFEKLRAQESLNFREEKISEFYKKIMTYETLAIAYEEPKLPRIAAGSEEDVRQAMMALDELARKYQQVDSMLPPAFIPAINKDAPLAGKADANWQAYAPAKFTSILDQVRGRTPNPAVAAMDELLNAVRTQDGKLIDMAAKKYRLEISQSTEVDDAAGRVNAEAFLNVYNPTGKGITLYLISLIVGVVAFAAPRVYSLRFVATGLLLGVFFVHTFGLLLRMYISGRAPVINLYSSAVFIGWACVLFSLVLEFVLWFSGKRFGGLNIATLVGAVIGLITLCIARSLDTSDTLHVLAAVLDTQFWLSTHVVIINLGYAVTFLAGCLGAAALITMIVLRHPNQNLEQIEPYKAIYRLAYFSVCFGILFSFVGTVLGGLWADDSWGRFWGWDPKENGALMIVLWNALVLHARWDRLVGLRGFSILALIGNIITSWSWFGTNLLGIGLHTYGFNKGVVYALVTTVLVHLAIIVVALVMTSARRRPSSTEMGR